MIFLFVIAGVIIGGVLAGAAGGFLGTVIGYLFATQLSMQEQLSKLEQQLKSWQEKYPEDKAPIDKKETPKSDVVEKVAVRIIEESSGVPESEIVAHSRVAKKDEFVEPIKVESSESGNSIYDGPSILSSITSFFSGGNTAVRIGVVVLFFGIAFLLKYAIDHNKLPIEYRLISTSIGAIVMLAIGWRLRKKRSGYALTMQGGAVGILYLVVFAALRLYHLIPPVAAFTLLIAIAAFSAILAILQNSMAFAVFGIVGGFLAPILTSTGSGDHVMLFSYYSVLNLGILAVAWFKSWRILNLIGFGFTFVIASIWGYRSYTPEHFSTTEPFLIFFVGLYVLIAILFATKQKPEVAGYVDGPIVFGTPMIGLGLQSHLVSQYEYGLAWSALGLGLFYMSLASFLYKRHSNNQKILVKSFLAIGVLFGTLVIPLAFDGRWTSAAWAMEGAAAIWLGIQQAQRLPRLFGVLLLFGSSAAFLIDVNTPVGPIPVLNSFFIGCLVISASALFASFQYFKSPGDLDAQESDTAHYLLLALGVGWWFFAGIDEISVQVAHTYKTNSLFVFVTLSSLLAVIIARVLSWKPIGYTALGLLPAMVIAAISMYTHLKHPLENWGFISWPIAFIVYYGLLKGHERHLQKNAVQYGHAVSFWLILFLVSWQAHWGVSQISSLPPVWLEVTLALVPSIFIYLAVQFSKKKELWPFGVHPRAYLSLASVPILAALWLGAVYISVTNTGDVWPLPYIPIFNPLDLTQLLVFVVALSWLVKIKPLDLNISKQENRKLLYGLGAGTVFIWLNAVLIRTIHHWVGIPFRFSDMFESIFVQTSLSIFWGLLGLLAMVIATRLRKRIVWYTGSGLLGVVVIKLFLVDLSQSGTIERIISFIVIGVLLLVVGYFTPMPPKDTRTEAGS